MSGGHGSGRDVHDKEKCSGYLFTTKEQTLLDCLWVHAKPNESDLQHIPYYLSGY